MTSSITKKILLFFIVLSQFSPYVFANDSFLWSWGNSTWTDLNLENSSELTNQDNNDFAQILDLSLSNSWTDKNLFSWETSIINNYDNQWLSWSLWQSWQLLDNADIFVNQSSKQEDIEPNIDKNMTPKLQITEVYFDGTDEFIEIYNSWEDFSWTISIIWAKSSQINLKDISIRSKNILIISDAWNHILDQKNTILDNWLNISDTKAINIQLSYSWSIIDSFNVSSNLVNELNNQKTSFWKYIDTNEIFISQQKNNFNISSDFIWNPWKVFESNSIKPIDPVDPPKSQEPKLVITEVFSQENQTRLEITNTSSADFFWDLQIKNLWEPFLNLDWVDIPTYTSQVFSNTDSLILFQDLSQVQTISSFPTIPNNQPINLELLRSWNVLDTFFVDETRVNYNQNSNSSFEKVLSWFSWYTTFVWLNTDRFFNISRWYSANPTTYFKNTENIIDVSIPKETNSNTSWNIDIPISCNDWRDNSTLKVSEIFPWNSSYESFIELDILDDITEYYDYIYLTWTLLSSDLWLDIYNADIQIEKNKKILVSKTDFWYREWMESIYNPNLSFTDSWFITIYWYDSYSDSMEILDSIQVTQITTGSSLYYNWQENQCIIKLDSVGKFSPWFQKKVLDYFNIDQEPKIIYRYSSWGWWSCSVNKDFILKQETNNNIEISTIKKYKKSDWEYIFFIKLKNKTNQDISIRSYNLQILENDEIVNIPYNSLFADQTMTFIFDEKIPIKNSCINLTKNKSLESRYCYITITNATQKDIDNLDHNILFWTDSESLSDEETQSTQETQTTNQTKKSSTTTQNTTSKNLNWILDIVNIIYNPDWADTNNEVVEIRSNANFKIDLRDIKIQYFKDDKNYSPKYLVKEKDTQFIYPNQTLQIKWTYSLPNSSNSWDVVVNLLYQDQIVANYSYNPSPTIPWQYSVKTVYDGDTFSIDFNWETQKVRLLWIDAPESSTTRFWYVECFGKESKEYLKDLIDDQQVEIYFDENTDKKDSYWRRLAYVKFNWYNLNESLISNWYAFEYTHNSQNYSQKEIFKNQQILAQNSTLWLRNSDTCNWSRTFWLNESQMKESTENKEYFDVQLKISRINFAPTTWQESITIELLNWDFVNLNNGFYLQRDTTKRNLDFWIIKKWEQKTIYWNFNFPNTKASCVKLMLEDQVFDTYCYDPDAEYSNEDESEETQVWTDLKKIIQTNSPLPQSYLSTQTQDFHMEIISILPNPIWSDKDKEEIQISLQWEFWTDSRPFLLIWEKKKYLDQLDFIQQWENTIIKNFSFPNSPTCVQVWFENLLSTKFCYPEPQEWQKYKYSNWMLESISTIDFTILKNSKLTQIDNKVCLTYQDQVFSCKTMWYSKLSNQKLVEVELNKEFLTFLNNELRNNRSWLYYNTQIKKQFDLYFNLQKQIKDWVSHTNINNEEILTTDYDSLYQKTYPATFSKFLSNNILALIPSNITQKLDSLRSEYFDQINQLALNTSI